MSWIKDALTEVDGVSFDIKRIAGASVLVGFHVGTLYDLIGLHHAFDPQAYGIGAGLIIAAIGAAILAGVTGEAKVAPAAPKAAA